MHEREHTFKHSVEDALFNLLISTEVEEGRPPIKVKFEIPYFTTSGIQVRPLYVHVHTHVSGSADCPCAP